MPKRKEISFDIRLYFKCMLQLREVNLKILNIHYTIHERSSQYEVNAKTSRYKFRLLIISTNSLFAWPL